MHLICANVQIQNDAAAIVAASLEEANMRLFLMDDIHCDYCFSPVAIAISVILMHGNLSVARLWAEMKEEISTAAMLLVLPSILFVSFFFSLLFNQPIVVATDD